MQSTSARISFIWIIILSLVTFSLAEQVYNTLEITIDVSPNVLNLQSSGKVVTVHTNIAYGTVEASSVYLNDVEISGWKSDLCGNFVAKFNIDDIKTLPLIINDYNTFTLSGVTKLGESFSGSQEILVVNKTSKNK